MTSAPSERVGRVRTKIVATLGPASAGLVRELASAGADAFRLNFSHGTHDDHAAALQAVRGVARETGRPLAVVQDLCGPKIRLGELPEGTLDVAAGEAVRIVARRRADEPRTLTLSHPEILQDLRAGERVAAGDGDIVFHVVSASAEEAVLLSEHAGRLRSHQGLNLPATALGLDALTDKDLTDLDWTARQGARGPELVALSFVRSAEDVKALRRELAQRGLGCHVVAKIEKPQAIERLDEIIEESDAIMVARGDLGVETDVARVPALQKRIVAACHAAGRPVVTATQMLASMERSPMPTRAEASDVFNAVIDGTDAVMLSGETAVGAHPALAVTTMSRIVAEAEAFLARDGALGPPGASGVTPITRAIVAAASLACREADAALLIVATHTGRTALAVSKRRNTTPTLALARAEDVASRMALYWGVVPMIADSVEPDAALEAGLAWARREGLVAKGDRVVLLSGAAPGGSIHDALAIREVR